MDLHEANQRLASGGPVSGVRTPVGEGPMMNTQEIVGLKKTIEEQKKIIEEKSVELDKQKKVVEDLEAKIKQGTAQVNVRILTLKHKQHLQHSHSRCCANLNKENV